MEVTAQQIYEAYRKLKCYYYYDNTTLFIKGQIAEFEEHVNNGQGKDFRDKFDRYTENLLAILKGEDKENVLFNSYLKKIDCRLVPKKICDKETEEAAKQEESKTDGKEDKKEGKEKLDVNFTFISNTEAKKDISIEQVNAIIYAPIEIHLISVLWVMLVGKELSSAISDNNYAYQLNFKQNDANEVSHGFKLFKPYYHGYQQWRDNAHATAQYLLDKKKNATIVSLDIQRYFYSIRANVQNLFDQVVDNYNEIELSEEKDAYKLLNTLLQSIHDKYANIVGAYIEAAKSDKVGETPFPVGLLSSGLLGNLYLSDFDRQVTEIVSPVYYGRYVDDMLFVFANSRVKDIKGALSFLNDKFCNNDKVLECTDDKHYSIRCHKELKIQGEKILVQHFDCKGSRAALDNFMNNIKRQRSEFRFLPDEDIVENNDEDAAYTIQYKGSINKLRSMQDMKEDKYGASTYLAQLIMVSRYWGKNEKKRLQKARYQILSFFKGRRAIEHHSLWEKAATFFIITGSKKELKLFCANALNAIDNIKGENNCDKLKTELVNYLCDAIALPLSLNLDFDITINRKECTGPTLRQRAEMIR